MDYEKLNALAQSEITQDSGITRGIRDYIFWVRNKLWLVVLITIVGIVVGIFVNSKSPDIYQAIAKFAQIHIQFSNICNYFFLEGGIIW